MAWSEWRKFGSIESYTPVLVNAPATTGVSKTYTVEVKKNKIYVAHYYSNGGSSQISGDNIEILADYTFTVRHFIFIPKEDTIVRFSYSGGVNSTMSGLHIGYLE